MLKIWIIFHALLNGISYIDLSLALQKEVGHPCPECYLFNIEQRKLQVTKRSNGVSVFIPASLLYAKVMCICLDQKLSSHI